MKLYEENTEKAMGKNSRLVCRFGTQRLTILNKSKQGMVEDFWNGGSI